MDTFGEFLKSFQPTQNGFFFMWILTGIAFTALLIMLERWHCINRLTNIDAPRFVDKLLNLINSGKRNEAVALCESGNRFALSRILGAGIKKSENIPELMRPAMEEESLHMIPKLEKRLVLIVTFGNLATLLGLMGTIYGLILAFAAVAQPDVSPMEKSSMLASGISAAMNTTLLGLVIAVPCVLIYSILRSRIDDAISEIDRYAIAILKLLTPEGTVQKNFSISSQRVTEEVDTEPNMVPFMNLMVVLIPLLLSSSEFVKIGMIELKLPESNQGAGGGGGNSESEKVATIDLGVVVTEKGFNLYHYFKSDTGANAAAEDENSVEIPLKEGEFDFETLNKKLSEVKQKALYGIMKSVKPELTPTTPLGKLYSEYSKFDLSKSKAFVDHENVKIVAEEKIKYQTIVSVMDAARAVTTDYGTVTMFPNVSIAGGVF